MENPFSVAFGRKPAQFVERSNDYEVIVDTFLVPTPKTNAYIITGVRGSGKTVSMNLVSEQLKNQGWIVIHLNVQRDLLQSLASKLYKTLKTVPSVSVEKLELSFGGVGVSLKKQAPEYDVEDIIVDLLEQAKQVNRRVLVCIDEIHNSAHVREFISAFQMFIGEDLPIYLLMTGLYKNVSDLQNDKSLTFLLRTPKLVLGAFDLDDVAGQYQEIFDIPYAKAYELASLTSGYAFGFQVLGSLYWENKQTDEIIDDYDATLEECVYKRLWLDLSDLDKEIVAAIASADDKSVGNLRDMLKMDSNKFNRYRARLIERGIIEAQGHGSVDFALPRFSEFVKNQMG